MHNQAIKNQNQSNSLCKHIQTITETYSRCTKKQVDKVDIIVQIFQDPDNDHLITFGEVTTRPEEVNASLRLEFIKSSTNNWGQGTPVHDHVKHIFKNTNSHGTGGTRIHYQPR